jgi:hypothetical protein
MIRKFTLGFLAVALIFSAQANERLFTYTYEPETMPQGGWEFEQWVTWRTQRTKDVGQDKFNRWEFRDSIEYGVTDNYTAEIYLNTQQQSFRDPATGADHSGFRWKGISLENRYQVLNPAEHKVGLTLYLEPTISDSEAELEQKIILGQRHGQWKWAFNLIHATELGDHFRETEGEVEATFGIARTFGKHWAVGIEARDHNELPEYAEWENTAFFLGPVVSYKRGNWWGALTVMPQIFGVNFAGDVDNNRHLELEGHERFNVRLIFGFGF